MFVLPKKVFLCLCCFGFAVASVEAAFLKDVNENITENSQSDNWKNETNIENIENKTIFLYEEIKEQDKNHISSSDKPFQNDSNEINQTQTNLTEQNQTETTILLRNRLINLRAKDIFSTGTEYIVSVSTEKNDVEDRFLLGLRRTSKGCAEGFKIDSHGNCRQIIISTSYASGHEVNKGVSQTSSNAILLSLIYLMAVRLSV